MSGSVPALGGFGELDRGAGNQEYRVLALERVFAVALSYMPTAAWYGDHMFQSNYCVVFPCTHVEAGQGHCP